MSLSGDIAACAALVERGDPLRFRTAMMAPLEARKRLFVLYAFNVEVSRAPWVTQEAMIAEMRLQWWRDVLEEIADGGAVRRHEVATPLGGILTARQARRLDALVVARRWDIYRDPFADDAEFDAYVIDTSAGLMQTAAELLADIPEGHAKQAGYAAGVGAWLRAIPELERQGRIPMVDGTPEGVRALAARGQAALSEARKQRFPRSAVPALLPATAAAPALSAARRAPSAVTSGDLPQPGLGLTVRAALGRW